MPQIQIGSRIEGAAALDRRQRITTVPVASMRTLQTTQIELVPSPGAGRAVFPEEAIIAMKGDTAFTGVASGEDLIIRYEDSTHAIFTIETTGFLDQTDEPIIMDRTGAAQSEVTPDKGLELYCSGGFGAGSDVEFKVRYTEFAV